MNQMPWALKIRIERRMKNKGSNEFLSRNNVDGYHHVH